MVEEEHNGGFDLVVLFNRYGRLTVSVADCQKNSNERNSSGDQSKNSGSDNIQPVTQNRLFSISEGKHDTIKSNDRMLVEGLRLGIVPSFSVSSFTFGRKSEISKIDEWLSSRKGTLLLFGDYGQGKSHTMRYIREAAVESGYGVAYCDIGSEAPMHKPKHVYRTLMKSLTFRSNNTGSRLVGLPAFLSEYAKHIRKGGENRFAGHRFFEDGIRELVKASGDLNSLHHVHPDEHNFLNWISGDNVSWAGYRVLPDHTTSANLYCNMLSAVGYASDFTSANNGVCYRGLILIFDEGESVDAPYVMLKNRERSLNFVKGLVEVSNNSRQIMGESVSNSDGLYLGRDSSLIYSGVIKDVPFAEKIPTNVKIVFAFVPGQESVTEELKSKYGCPSIELEEMRPENKRELIAGIMQLYSNAYGIAFEKEGQREFITKRILDVTRRDKNTRSIIKSTVEALDLYRFNRGVELGVLLRT